MSGCQKQDDSIKIGLNLELSGRLAQYGRECKNGAMLAQKQINLSGGINGKSLNLIIMDNRSENSDAALAAIRLASADKVKIIVGPTTSAGVKASASSISGLKVPIITPTGTADDLTILNGKVNPYIFRVCFTDQIQGAAMGKFAVKIAKTAVILADSGSDYSRGIAKSFAGEYIKDGGHILMQEYYNSGDCDFTALLTKIGAKHPDAIYLPGYYVEAGLIIRQARELGINIPILGGDAFDSSLLPELAGGADNLNGVYYTNHCPANLSGFFESYQKEYGHQAGAYAALGYDAVMLAARAIAENDPKGLVNALENVKNFDGAAGKLQIDANHNAIKKVYIVGYKNGKLVDFE